MKDRALSKQERDPWDAQTIAHFNSAREREAETMPDGNTRATNAERGNRDSQFRCAAREWRDRFGAAHTVWSPFVEWLGSPDGFDELIARRMVAWQGVVTPSWSVTLLRDRFQTHATLSHDGAARVVELCNTWLRRHPARPDGSVLTPRDHLASIAAHAEAGLAICGELPLDAVSATLAEVSTLAHKALDADADADKTQ